MERVILVQDCRIPESLPVEGELAAGNELIIAWRVQQRLGEMGLGIDCRIYAGDSEAQRQRAEAINDSFGYTFSCSAFLTEVGASGDPDKLYEYLRSIDSECGTTAVLVAHEGVVGKIIAWWLGVGSLATTMRGSHAGVTVLEIEGGKRVLTSFNDTRHITEAPSDYQHVDPDARTACDICPEQCREVTDIA